MSSWWERALLPVPAHTAFLGGWALPGWPRWTAVAGLGWAGRCHTTARCRGRSLPLWPRGAAALPARAAFDAPASASCAGCRGGPGHAAGGCHLGAVQKGGAGLLAAAGATAASGAAYRSAHAARGVRSAHAALAHRRWAPLPAPAAEVRTRAALWRSQTRAGMCHACRRCAKQLTRLGNACRWVLGSHPEGWAGTLDDPSASTEAGVAAAGPAVNGLTKSALEAIRAAMALEELLLEECAGGGPQQQPAPWGTLERLSPLLYTWAQASAAGWLGWGWSPSRCGLAARGQPAHTQPPACGLAGRVQSGIVCTAALCPRCTLGERRPVLDRGAARS